MVLNKFGVLVAQQWEQLPKRFPNIGLGAFVVMPNHVHMIIQIVDASRRGTAEDFEHHGDRETRRAPTREQFQKPVKGSIPTIVRSYKSAVSYRINLMRGTQDVPVWQRNYYEHVIRNDKDLQNKTDYIHANPLLWERDHDNPMNIEP
jgi:REP element-mobilizing transposase RayT